MKKWRCLVCDLIYDEAEGWPDDGIAPGTRWEDVPEDWACPYCGVGKEDFDMVEIKDTAVSSAPDMSQSNSIDPTLAPVVIIGAGMAAYNLAKEFRKHDSKTPVKIISRDEAQPYYKPNLSCMLTEKKCPDDLVMAQDPGAEVIPLSVVTGITPATKTIHLGKEEMIYGKLVLATGAGLIPAPVTGDARDLILGINDLLDYRNFRTALAGASRVAIIGAGLIGCEFANDMLNAGLDVDIIDPAGHCMSSLLPEEAGEALATALGDLGGRFYLNRTVTDVRKQGSGFLLTLSDGTLLESDLVISAVGLKPRIELAEAAGLKTGRGIIVDDYLATSDPHIYALGDCAELNGQVRMYVEPLVASAKALARTLAGTPTAVALGPLPVVVKTPACPVVVTPLSPTVNGTWHVETDGYNVRALFKSPAGQLHAFALTGDHSKDHKTLRHSLSPE
ncbi:FAD-dependent oxidoreductase [Paremcibacter congregatus]|uniref:Rubredoxin reductase n=1 Tax=Paremcibacter congregatus TaxID=2043170 RepID=A0A2G4YQI2_9PROT|nr:rubredoxin reductase [Paremcibacter congregatus]QDE28815.1 rubredoxin reductase [Paremcibacter congregatus]